MSYRILVCGEHWYGSNVLSFVTAFRKLGHSVQHVSEQEFLCLAWQSFRMKVWSRLLRGQAVAELNRHLVAEAERFRPDFFFAFKGAYLVPATLRAFRSSGIPSINFYPDISMFAHGPHLAKSLPEYDWILTTKSFGLDDLEQTLQMTRASFLPHGFDPDIHRPPGELADADREQYGCDVVFVGAWSPKKQELLEHVMRELPQIEMRIWGDSWKGRSPALERALRARRVTAGEYAKAIGSAKIALGLLTERGPGASSGDLTTTRSFEIPAIGCFMLHESNAEIAGFFDVGSEIEVFDGRAELAEKIRHYLARPGARDSIAAAGHRRVFESGYSIVDRAGAVVRKYEELRDS